jgi:threonylcarbamoyladenosine tRNA methylthiotransferase CDKAL1
MQGPEHEDHPLGGLDKKRVYIETYGCRYNFGDTARLWEILRKRNCSRVGAPEEADAVIVNTCTVVAPTERRMLRRLSRLRDFNLYVTGCMPEVQREAIMAVCTPKFIPPALITEEYRNAGTV